MPVWAFLWVFDADVVGISQIFVYSINPGSVPLAGFFYCRSCFSNGYFHPFLSGRLLVFILYFFYPLCSFIVTLYFLPDISPQILKSFFPRRLGDFDGLFPKLRIESFGVFFEHFFLLVKRSYFLKAPYSLGFS